MRQNTVVIEAPVVFPNDPVLPKLLAEGLIHHQANRLKDAERIYVAFLQRNPGHPQALAFRGVIMAQNKNYGVATRLLSQAIQGNANLADPRYCLGNIFSVQGHRSHAVIPYTNAMALGHPRAKERLEEVLNQLGKEDRIKSFCILANFYLSNNRYDQALRNVQAAIKIDPDVSSNWVLFSRCLSNIRFTTPVREDLLNDIECAFYIENLDYRQIVRAAITALANDQGMSPLFSACGSKKDIIEYLREQLRSGGIVSLSRYRLLRRMLEVAVVIDVGFERLLTALRHAMLLSLADESGGPETEPQYLPLISSLALQCFLNEYCWALSDEEIKAIDVLSKKISDRVESNEYIPASWIAVLGAYKPLYTLDCAARLQVRQRDELASVVRVQLTEPLEELRLRETIEEAVPITGDISELVRSQYEESPYPRWATLPVQGEPVSLADYMARVFPKLDEDIRKQPGHAQVLVAGCGTGLIPNYLAKHIRHSSVTALDLSLSSLSYAKRKSAELGIDNIDYIHGDIQNLRMLEREFDHINCYGVLHHMEDTLTGWAVLTDCLKPNGTMEIGLYSKIARRPVSHAHEFIKMCGYEANMTDMRRCRQDIIEQKNDVLLQTITEAPDFYSMSEFRDLVFHYQEHFLTLPEIGEMINALGLEFLGFVFSDPAVIPRYRQMFPQDPDMISFDLWDRFEEKYPKTFASIYKFWVHKPA